jgi:hypothetical protein
MGGMLPNARRWVMTLSSIIANPCTISLVGGSELFSVLR